MESDSQDQGLVLRGLLCWGPGSTALGPRWAPAPWAEGSPLGGARRVSRGEGAASQLLFTVFTASVCVHVCNVHITSSVVFTGSQLPQRADIE